MAGTGGGREKGCATPVVEEVHVGPPQVSPVVVGRRSRKQDRDGNALPGLVSLGPWDGDKDIVVKVIRLHVFPGKCCRIGFAQQSKERQVKNDRVP